jgi:glucose-6-phosphate isomerase
MYRATLRFGFAIAPGLLSDALRADAAAAARAADGLWRRDPAVWTSDSVVREKIANRLGWLTCAPLMLASLERLRQTAVDVRQRGFEDIVLLGMGGSSLAPEVLRAVIGIQPGWPRLHMLDSTDPAAVHAAETAPSRTIYILASKSGTTIEPNSLAAHFRHCLEDAGIANWASHFIAITDEGTELAALAQRERFRHAFINPSDIGGRYSALSFFGMVPAALMGQDVEAILRWSDAMLQEAQAADDPLANPAVGLGLLMATAARSGRDKLTLVLPRALEPFGLWVEQLVAESTGKRQVGIVPIAGETLAEPHVYGGDRVFARLRDVRDRDEERRDAAVDKLAPSPLASMAFEEPAALGAEFMRWEIATAIAGALLDVNPFDEPNVQQAKDATRLLLERYEADRELPRAAPDLTRRDGIAVTLTTAARNALGAASPEALLTLLGPRDYFALLAFVGPDPALADVLRALRMTVRDSRRVATMFGYGPRYLHSTGQLHKGGPNSGVFLLITTASTVDAPVPGQPFSFGTLELAQALGDFASLDATGRRAAHLHLPSPDPQALERACASFTGHLAR